MTFRFQEGDEVVLINGDDHARFLRTGSQGIVFCQYATTPPAYEVNFRDIQGEEFGVVVYEDEIESAHEKATSPTRAAAGVA